MNNSLEAIRGVALIGGVSFVVIICLATVIGGLL